MKFILFETLAELSITTVITLIVATVLSIVMIVLLVRAAKSPRHVNESNQNTTKTLVYGALCVALSFILSYFKLLEMPQGGSITLCSILPVALYANWFGLKRGIIAGAVYGILEFIQYPIVVHAAQPVLDYLLAFACIGLAGAFPKNLLAGLFVGGMGRVICSTIAGALFFAEYAPEGMNPWVYSFIYNAMSLGPDALICIAVAALAPVRKVFTQLRPVAQM